MEHANNTQISPGVSFLSSLGKIVLIALTLLSFNPQLRRIHDLDESTGISLFYLLINLIVATEQLTVGLLLIAYDFGVDVISHAPKLPGDWLNLLQFATVWLCHLVLWIYCLTLSPARLREKRVVIIAYSIFFLCSLGLALLGGVELLTANAAMEPLLVPMLILPHLAFINPIMSLVGVMALLAQVQQMGEHLPQSRYALSTNGLLLQAAVFVIIGISWIFRLVPDNLDGGLPDSWSQWFVYVGWAAFDNLIFAFVQAALYCIVRMRDRAEEFGETTRLLY